MSTTLHPPRANKSAPQEAGITSGNSTRSQENFVVAAKIARIPNRVAGNSGKEGRGAHPQQLTLLFDPPTNSPPHSQFRQKPRPPTAAVIERFATLDQRMTTADVLRVVGVNRSTIFRWVKRGIFPQRHASGGWLRSDVEKWLAEKMDYSR